MSNLKAVILLSGGLDSIVSLAAALKGESGSVKCDVKLALTFDYGQRSVEDEIKAAAEICKVYGIEHRVIKIPFLEEISNSALNKKDEKLEFNELGTDSMKAVWVPNRNGLFLNIAACFCDSIGYDAVIIGANKEEAATFSDNSAEFCMAQENAFKYSTLNGVRVIAPLIDLEKYEIINLAVQLGVDLSLLKSCYNASNSGKVHCGVCESCKRLRAAILKSNHGGLIKLFF